MKKRRQKEDDASFWMGLVLGIFIGGAVALVLTPGSGEENRAMLMDKAQETIEKAQETVEQKVEAAEDKAHEARSNIESTVEDTKQ
jgi:gas vesicle protein